MAAPLAYLFEKSMTTSDVPTQWKQALVVPVFKKGSPSKVENYRPISLTCVPCRVMEGIIATGLRDHMSNNKLLSPTSMGLFLKDLRSYNSYLVVMTGLLLWIRV